ncbi:hybrid signal transduction histidine kinase M [Tanacetum coccineum]
MAGDDAIPPQTTNEKPFGITNIKTYIPLVLDLDELNYDLWSELFTLHCKNFGVLKFIVGTSMSADQASDEWGKLDSLQLKDVFHDNKNVRAMQLDNDLRTIEIGNMSITDYFHKIRRMADLLANIDAPVDEKILVSYVINGLGDCFDQVVGIIHHRDPTPTFAQTQSMLLLEKSRLARKSSRHSFATPLHQVQSFLLLIPTTVTPPTKTLLNRHDVTISEGIATLVIVVGKPAYFY